MSEGAGPATPRLGYALVTPARNEAENLGRLAACLLVQTVRPQAWVIVENGSTDRTSATAEALAADHDWIHVVHAEEAAEAVRGGAIVRAFTTGVEALPEEPDLVVNLDADVSFQADFFERLLRHFEDEPTLGIASGTALELEDGEWREQFVTRTTVWGAVRAYRWACFRDVSPLEERLGWDGLDELTAVVRGWKAETLRDLPFRHHRKVGQRDSSRRATWVAEGRLAHYMHYRPGYLVVRSLFQAAHRRRPAALGMVWGYGSAAIRREPRWDDDTAAAHLRELQRLRALPSRAREALGRRA
jgi:glycosyltransferase involved in cell wall biosynthesis